MGKGLISRGKVNPNTYKKYELKKGTYMFAAYDANKEKTLSMPATREIAADEKKYTKHTNTCVIVQHHLR